MIATAASFANLLPAGGCIDRLQNGRPLNCRGAIDRRSFGLWLRAFGVKHRSRKMHSANCSGLFHRLHFAVIRIRSGCIARCVKANWRSAVGQNHLCKLFSTRHPTRGAATEADRPRSNLLRRLTSRRRENSNNSSGGRFDSWDAVTNDRFWNGCGIGRNRCFENYSSGAVGMNHKEERKVDV